MLSLVEYLHDLLVLICMVGTDSQSLKHFKVFLNGKWKM